MEETACQDVANIWFGNYKEIFNDEVGLAFYFLLIVCKKHKL
jgi:hypothetical protein